MKARVYMKKTVMLLGAGLLLSLSLYGTTKVNADEAYTVKQGDTLSSIINSHYGNLDNMFKLAKDNNIDNLHLIYVGQTINLKDDLSSIQLTEADKQHYTVQLTGAEMEQVEASAPVQEVVEPVQESQPVQEAPVEQKVEQPATAYTSSTSSAKEWIAMKESGGSYTATNGQYYGRYQLTGSYLNGDYSPENQERVADAYVMQRYGSWESAQAFWLANGWY